MALSNWDALTLNEQGPTTEAFKTPSGVELLIFKNWLYVSDPRAAVGAGFTAPVVMQIEQGVLTYGDLHIEAERGPQEGIYVVATVGGIHEPTQVYVGCGLFGWRTHREKLLAAGDVEGADEWAEPIWDGVLANSLRHLRQLVFDVLGDRSPITEQMWTEAVRYCQGDRFFLHADGVPRQQIATAPGQASTPVMIQQMNELANRAHES